MCDKIFIDKVLEYHNSKEINLFASAIENNDIEFIKLLIYYNFSSNGFNLNKATYKNNMEIIKLLINYNLLEEDKEEAILGASFNGYVEILVFLLENINVKDKIINTAIGLAKVNGLDKKRNYKKVIKILEKYKKDFRNNEIYGE